jgi:hypothetical protein
MLGLCQQKEANDGGKLESSSIICLQLKYVSLRNENNNLRRVMADVLSNSCPHITISTNKKECMALWGEAGNSKWESNKAAKDNNESWQVKLRTQQWRIGDLSPLRIHLAQNS